MTALLLALAGGLFARSSHPVRAAGSAGYWLVSTDGGVFSFGRAGFYGAAGNPPLNQPAVAIAPTPSGRGYWILASDGGLFAFGDAGFYGSMGGSKPNKPIVAMAPTPSGRGYWIVASDGGLFAFGDAGFYGSMGGEKLNKPIVDFAATPSGAGYWMASSEGGVFAFGDAGFYGAVGAADLAKRIHALAATPSGRGYWLVGGDGAVFAFGDAASLGSASAEKRVIDMASSATGRGYYVTTSNGQVLGFGDAEVHGGADDLRLNNRIAGMAAINGSEPPEAAEDLVTAEEDTETTIDAATNDADPDGGALSVVDASQPGHGSATVGPGGVSYRPAPDYFGLDSFTYTVADDTGATASGLVTITVEPVDDVPKAMDDEASLGEETSVTATVLANDTGLGDGLQEVSISSNPRNGTATIEADGTVTYVPKPNFSGGDSFDYRVVDADDDTSSATVKIMVLPTDDVPVAVDDSASAESGRTITIDVLDNDDAADGVDHIEFTNPDGTPRNVGSVTTLAGGKAERSKGAIRYTSPETPPADGADSFRYVVFDRDGTVSNPATVSVTVSANEVPTAAAKPSSVETAERTPAEVALIGRDTGGAVTFEVVDPPKNGKLVRLDANPSCSGPTGACGQRYSYAPNDGFTGADAFTFEAKDQGGKRSDPVTVNINVVPGQQTSSASGNGKGKAEGKSTGAALAPLAARLRPRPRRRRRPE